MARNRNSAAMRAMGVGLAAMLVGGALPLGDALADRATTAAAFSLDTIGGRSWTTDIRVSNMTLADTLPQAYIDTENNVHFLWRQTNGSNLSYYHAVNDLAGFRVQNETYITNRVVAGWGPTYPLGPAAGIDSHGDIHVAFDANFMDITYSKYSGNGSELIAPRRVGPADSSSSHVPTLAVAPDDTIHIAHEDYKYQCEEIFYNKIDANGADVFLGRVVSPDVGSMKEFSTVKVDKFGSGSVLFGWGSGVGTGVGRYSRYGVQDMSSVIIRPNNDYRLVDLDQTPDGAIHVVWQESGVLKYTRINSSGGKVIDGANLTGGATAVGYPRVATAAAGEAIITWQDTRTGRSQIMYAVVNPTDNVSLVPQIQLTSSPGSARDPWVTPDGRGGMVIAWSDDRDGNPEIYYKQTYQCGLALTGDLGALRGTAFWHPNETRVLPLRLSNGGLLEDDFSLDLNLSSNASAAGWQASLDVASPIAVLGKSDAAFALTIGSPPAARDGDTMSLTLSAAAVNLGNCSKPLRLSGVVHVSRGLTIASGTPAKVAENGETVSFDVEVTNRGEVPEEAVEILSGGRLAPPGWAVTTNVSQLSLQPNESRTLAVSVTVPPDLREAPADLTVQLGIEARAADDPSVTALQVLHVTVNATFGLYASLEPASHYVKPGVAAHFAFLVTTAGNLGRATAIGVSGALQGAPGWSATPDTVAVYLEGGQQARVTWDIRAPANAAAGTRATFEASATSAEFGLKASAAGTVEVLPSCNFTVDSPPLSAQASLGPLRFNFTLANNGNFKNFPTAVVTNKPAGWTARFLSGSQPATAFVVDAFSLTPAVLEVAPPAGVLAGDYAVPVRIDAGACGSWEATARVAVPESFGLSFASASTTAAAPLGGDATFALTMGSNSNRPADVALSVSPLPQGFAAQLKRIGPDGVTDFAVFLDGPLHLDPGESASVRLHVWLPVGTQLDRVPLTITAQSSGGPTQTLNLAVEVLRADLRVMDVRRDLAEAVEGDVVHFSVSLANLGQAPSAPGTFSCYLDGELLYSQFFTVLNPGENFTFEFAWVATKGYHTLRANATSASTVEVDGTNNEMLGSIDVAAEQQAVTAVQAEPTPWALYLIIAAEGGLLALVCVYPRRRTEEELEAAARLEAAKAKAAAAEPTRPASSPPAKAPPKPAPAQNKSTPAPARQQEPAPKPASPQAAPKSPVGGAPKPPPKFPGGKA